MDRFDFRGDPRVQGLRRATTATSILDIGAWIGLAAGMLFWSNFFWTIMAPGSPPEIMQMLAMAAGYSLVLPMLLSTLVPSTPAGMLLQQTRWKTVGFVVTIVITGFLGYHALLVLRSYWESRELAAASGQALPLAIGSLIIFVFVPALAWVQASPDRWLAEVQSANAVKRLKLAQEANIMTAKQQYLRTMSLLRRGVANLTAAEHQELAGSLVMFQRAENEALGQVVDTLETLTGVSTGVRLLDDTHLERAYTDITDSLARLITQPNPDYVEQLPAASAAAALPPPPAAAIQALRHAAQQDAVPAYLPPPAAAAAAAASAATRRDSPRYAAEFRAVAAATPEAGVFTAKRVAEIVGKSDRTARDMITAWIDAGWIARGDAANSYYITEGY